MVSSTNLHFGVCGKKPHQSISPLRCGPLVEPRQEPLQDTTLGIQYYFQIFPDFTELNSAKVMFHFSLRKTYQINIKSGTTQDCSKCSENQFFIILHQPEFFQNFWNFSCMCCIFTCYNSCQGSVFTPSQKQIFPPRQNLPFFPRSN